MRIAFVVGSFPELSATFILDQIAGLIDAGHDVHVFARAPREPSRHHPLVDEYALLRRTHYWRRDPFTPLDVAARSLRVLRTQPAQAIRALVRCLEPRASPRAASAFHLWAYSSELVMAGSFDVALAHFGPNAVIAQRLRDIGALRAPLASVFHGYDLTRVLKQRGADYYRDVVARSELLLPVSRRFASELIALGAPAERVRVHRMGVDTAAFAFEPRERGAGEPLRLVSVCRLVEKKGLAFGLRALRELASRGLPFEWHIAGDGPLRGELEALRIELGLERRVVFHGAKTRDEVQRMLASSHAFLAPSVTASDGDQEGVPVAIMEAMASGLPVVSTLHSGIPELIEDRVNGLLVPERDIAALAGCIAGLIAEPARAPELARAARATVEARFDTRKLNAELAAMLAELAERPARAAEASGSRRMR